MEFQHVRIGLGETGRLVLQGGGDGATQGVALCFEQLDFAFALGHRASLSCPAPPPFASAWASATKKKPTHRREGVGSAYTCNWNNSDRPRPTVCPFVASRNLLLYQSLPSSIPYRHANVRRRKDDPG